MWYSNSHCEQVECEICGTTLSEYHEGRLEPYMPSVTSMGGGYCLDPRAQTMQFSIYPACLTCAEKYGPELEQIRAKFLEEKRAENAGLRGQHETERKAKEAKCLKDQIERLKEVLKGLGGE